jgi:broad specificity phosphatase PhoE
MQPLFLVRHAPVKVDLSIPAHEWQLSAEGYTLAERLAALPIFAGLRTVWASPEPKAQATAKPLAHHYAASLLVHPDLSELRRSPTNIADREAYETAVRQAFANPETSVAGWERAAHAQRRIVGCVLELAAQTREPMAVVSHGLVLSLLLAHLRGQSQVDFAEWRSIPLPALAIVDADTWRVAAPFRSVAAWESDVLQR